MATCPANLDYDFPLAGRTAFVTGAASGIGAAIADAFAEKGVRVAVVDLKAEEAEAKANSLPGALAVACDVADPASVEAAVAKVKDAFGRIDILVNSASIVDLAPAQEISMRAWTRTIDINLTGSFIVSQAVRKAMIARQGGRIINLASQAGSMAARAWPCSTASLPATT